MPGKSAVGSLTVWGAAIVLLAQLAQGIGYTISPDDQAALVNLIDSGVTAVTTIVSLVGAGMALWGRIRASKPITSALPGNQPPRSFSGLAVLLAAALALALSACTAAQIERAQSYQQAIAAACQVAVQVAPLNPGVAPWIIGGCASEAAIAKLALDPGSLVWVNDLIAKARSGA